jgi:addiction module RelE/StbE family toxin
MNILELHEFIVEFEGLDKDTQRQIKQKLKDLYRTPLQAHTPIPLKGARFKGLHKLRIEDWRLIYRVERDALVFITLGHRSDVYKGMAR